MVKVKHSDISFSLCTFLLKLMGIWFAESRIERYQRRLMLCVTLSMMMWAELTEAREVYYSMTHDVEIMSALGTVMNIIMAAFKICNILIHKADFLSLISYVRNNFLNAEYDSYEEKILHGCTSICGLFVFSVSIFGFIVFVSYVVTPVIATMARNDSIKVLPLSCCVELESPYYELAFVSQIAASYNIAMCYFCFDNMLCILSIHVGGQFRILQYRLATLCNVEGLKGEKTTELEWTNHIDNIYQKFKQYVKQHQALIEFCEKLENVYTMIVLAQVAMFSILICLYGYQILLADAIPATRILFLFLLADALFLLFMFTYSCDSVIEESENVALGAYSAMWSIMPMNRSGKNLRKDLIMVMIRAQRFCCLTANGFFPVSLKTFTSILSTAVSYFTLVKSRIEMEAEE